MVPLALKEVVGFGGAMATRPHIFWIVTTQWRAQAFGHRGDQNARTPGLDALARQSVNFVQAVTPHPFGPFARAAMLTGQRSPANGVREYFDPLPIYGPQVRAGLRDPSAGLSEKNSPHVRGRTIAHDLATQGYGTAFFGKWHLARRDPRAALVGEAHARMIVPVEARGGFEFWEGFESGFLLNNPWLHGTRLPEPVEFIGYQSEILCRRAAEWFEEHARSGTSSRRALFCMVSLEAPHPPYDAPASGVLGCEPQHIVLEENVPRGGDVEQRARRDLAGYYAHIEATDRAVARLVAQVDAIAQKKGEEPPIVVFTSVHGDMHGAHGRFRKGWPYEESVRVPLLIRRGGHANAGEVNGGLISLVDLPRLTSCWGRGDDDFAFPTVAQISMPSVVALPDQCDRVWRGVRTAERKLVINADGSPWLFFDLKNDPAELRNLVADPARAPEIAALRRCIAD